MAKSIYNAAGVTRLTLGAGVSANVGDLIGHDGSNWVLADADARVPAQFMAMESVGAASAVNVCQTGVLFDSLAPYTAGNDQYLSTTAGAHTATRPALTTTLTITQRIGKALATDTIAFNLVQFGPVLLRANVTYDPASLATVLARSDTVALTGLLTTDLVRVHQGAPLTGTGWDTGLVVQGADVSASDTLRVRLINPTAGALDGASITFAAYVERF
jgi:hypothetical protein